MTKESITEIAVTRITTEMVEIDKMPEGDAPLEQLAESVRSGEQRESEITETSKKTDNRPFPEQTESELEVRDVTEEHETKSLESTDSKEFEEVAEPEGVIGDESEVVVESKEPTVDRSEEFLHVTEMKSDVIIPSDVHLSEDETDRSEIVIGHEIALSEETSHDESEKVPEEEVKEEEIEVICKESDETAEEADIVAEAVTSVEMSASVKEEVSDVVEKVELEEDRSEVDEVKSDIGEEIVAEKDNEVEKELTVYDKDVGAKPEMPVEEETDAVAESISEAIDDIHVEAAVVDPIASSISETEAVTAELSEGQVDDQSVLEREAVISGVTDSDDTERGVEITIEKEEQVEVERDEIVEISEDYKEMPDSEKEEIGGVVGQETDEKEKEVCQDIEVKVIDDVETSIKSDSAEEDEQIEIDDSMGKDDEPITVSREEAVEVETKEEPVSDRVSETEIDIKAEGYPSVEETVSESEKREELGTTELTDSDTDEVMTKESITEIAVTRITTER
ncbi:hypothetical protein LSH36_484g04132 [Paralvinella palmiformis]|uniref:Uncharacterized protein n=1 Tax=Paralvinella palmiformis TaxID=53620 RepID=A0AAD9JAB1_9ANNE|nr:hypothetical protein LSH36_484g04132 [Paralvinella palmiformis]